ncbi:transposase [Rhodococcus erythropolis]|uniref:IS110 family transposase n=1 Tax=Rhodococcus erythropolis TaxID=1833 RepID=UPI00294A2B2A|nr:transposase [Rhodococcus erythropolis]MDV6278237.1 transposase [Rhodococcus erythropolis]
MSAVWAGIDSGKWTHHCVVIDEAGAVLLSTRVVNDETVLEDLIDTVAGIADGSEHQFDTVGASNSRHTIGLTPVVAAVAVLNAVVETVCGTSITHGPQATRRRCQVVEPLQYARMSSS